MSETKKLALIGTGIKTLSHITEEAKTYLEKADIVLYLVNEPVLEQYIKEVSSKSKSLHSLYFKNPERQENYIAIVDTIIEHLNEYSFVTVVFYGHPTVFASPGLLAVNKARNQGVETVIIPAISAEDCLYADLGIDPGGVGSMSIEASEFLFKQRTLDHFAHVTIWQLAMLGNYENRVRKLDSQHLKAFINKLGKFYPMEHSIIIYEAAIYPGIAPRIETFKLKNLSKIELSPLSTLYLPPCEKAELDKDIMEMLKVEQTGCN